MAALRATRVLAEAIEPNRPYLFITTLTAVVTTEAAVAAPLPDLTCDSFATVTVVAATTSGVADSWQWRQVSGPAVTLNGTGSTRWFTAPPALDGTKVVIGARPVTGAVAGSEVTTTVTVRPHTIWGRASGSWVGLDWRTVVAATFALVASATPGLYDLTPGGTDVRQMTTLTGESFYDVPPGSNLTLAAEPGFYDIPEV